MKNLGSRYNRHLKPWDRHCQPSFFYKHHKKHKIVPKCNSKNVWDTNPFQSSELITMYCVWITRDLCWNSWEEFRCIYGQCWCTSCIEILVASGSYFCNEKETLMIFHLHRAILLQTNSLKWSAQGLLRLTYTHFHNKIPFPCNKNLCTCYTPILECIILEGIFKHALSMK